MWNAFKCNNVHHKSLADNKHLTWCWGLCNNNIYSAKNFFELPFRMFRCSPYLLSFRTIFVYFQYSIDISKHWVWFSRYWQYLHFVSWKYHNSKLDCELSDVQRWPPRPKPRRRMWATASVRWAGWRPSAWTSAASSSRGRRWAGTRPGSQNISRYQGNITNVPDTKRLILL